MKLVSVIIAVFNGENYLRRNLDSLLEQSYKNLEIICVNDGSTDTSEEIIKSYIDKDSRINLINKINGGVSSARNAGIDAAHGDYITFLDCDDYYDTTNIEKMATALDVDNIQMSACSICEMNEMDADYKRFRQTGSDLPMTKEGAICSILDIHGMCVEVWNKMFKRGIVEQYYIRFNEKYNYSEDMLFVCEYILHCDQVIYLSDVLVYHTFYSTGAMNSRLMAPTFNIKWLDEYNAHTIVDQWFKENRIGSEKVENMLGARYVFVSVWLLKLMYIHRYNNKALIVKYRNTIRKNVKSYMQSGFGGNANKIAVVLNALSPALEYIVFDKVYRKLKRG